MNAHSIANMKEKIIAELERRDSSNSLAAYIKAAWPLIEPKHPFIPGWHIDAIAEHLEAVYAGEIRNLLINIPPRHAKSTIISVAFPSWVWSKRPEFKFLYGSHAFSLSKRDSVKCRNVIQSQWYRDTFNIKWNLAEDQNEKMRFDNTEGGSRISTSVGSSVIGEGGDILVLDDPHSPKSVRSEVQRHSELDWVDQEFFTRINDPKTVAKIIIMQRLDERDASAHVLAQGDWEHLMLPAQFEPERKCVTVLGWEDPRKEKDEPLWPERFGEPELLNVKKGMGSKAWAGQGQQRPAPSEGNIFKREWWKWYKESPDQLRETMQFIGLSVDLSFDEGANASFAVFQTWGRRGADKFLLGRIKAQVGFNQQLVMFKGEVGKWRPHAKWVEKKANGAALISVVQREIPGVIAVEPRGSKVARAEAISPQVEAGNVFLPDPSIAPWISDYVEELATFPNAAYDDDVDATSQALLKLSETAHVDWKPVHFPQTSKFYGR